MTDKQLKHLTQEVIEKFADEMRIGPEDYQKLLDTFVSCNHERIKTLTAALSGNDTETAISAVHSIKGTASTMRISWMASVAAKMEEQLKEGHFTGHEDALDTLRTDLELIRNDAREYALAVSKDE